MWGELSLLEKWPKRYWTILKRLYSVQIGGFADLPPYADDTLELKKGEPSPAVAAKILQTFAEFKETSVEGEVLASF